MSPSIKLSSLLRLSHLISREIRPASSHGVHSAQADSPGTKRSAYAEPVLRDVLSPHGEESVDARPQGAEARAVDSESGDRHVGREDQGNAD